MNDVIRIVPVATLSPADVELRRGHRCHKQASTGERSSHRGMVGQRCQRHECLWRRGEGTHSSSSASADTDRNSARECCSQPTAPICRGQPEEATNCDKHATRKQGPAASISLRETLYTQVTVSVMLCAPSSTGHWRRRSH
jgi:hypothetical protein